MSTSQPGTTVTLARPALQAFLADIVDYAGLFPPAGLPLNEAISNYARYRSGSDAWMLGPFVIPVKRLGELDAFASLSAIDPPFRFSVLGMGGSEVTFVAHLAEDLAAIQQFHARHPGQVHVDAMEVRLPAALLDDPSSLTGFIQEVGLQCAAALPDLALFFEVPIDENLENRAPALLEVMAAHNQTQETQIGFKMRTGGLEPAAFPNAGHLAYAIVACHRAGVHFKATAGLHHPVRTFHESVQTKMYGFFNLFGAAVLTAVHDLDESTVQAILLDEEAAHFHFDETGFSWNDLSAPIDDITHLRNTFALSVGSCSFDEPREDLRALGLF